ncbi:MAG: hypothetical protein KDG56_06240, partial [Ottowia sp.]|nr:hypothetical protein [Ottowia sp.]
DIGTAMVGSLSGTRKAILSILAADVVCEGVLRASGAARWFVPLAGDSHARVAAHDRERGIRGGPPCAICLDLQASVQSLFW